MKDYLYRKNIPVKLLAGNLGISTSYLYQIIRGERKPSIELAQRIEEYTEGEVTVGQLLGFEEQGAERPAGPLEIHRNCDQRLSTLEEKQIQISEKMNQIESRLGTLEERK